MQRRAIILCAACFGILWAAAAFAGSVSYQYAFDQTNYIVAPNGTVNVGVYLVETVDSGGVSVLSSSGVGMSGAGVQVYFSDSPQPADPATVVSTAAIAANSAFDQSSTSLSSGSALLSEYVFFNDYVHGAQPDPNQTIYQMSIGTFTFTSGAISGNITPIRAAAYGTANINVTAGGVVLDSLIAQSTATITTTYYGDANLDGLVNGADLGVVLANFNKTFSSNNWTSGDFNGDGVVNGADLGVVLANFNQSVNVESPAAFMSPHAVACPNRRVCCWAALPPWHWRPSVSGGGEHNFARFKLMHFFYRKKSCIIVARAK